MRWNQSNASQSSLSGTATWQRLLTLGMLLIFPTVSHACWEEAGEKYGINPYLLAAIAKTESNFNPKAINRKNRNGSYDIGLMQINSTWLPALKKYGISEKDLYDPCVSIHVGAWVLAQNVQRLGNSWTAVGAYNARNPDLRQRYAQKVYQNLPHDLRR